MKALRQPSIWRTIFGSILGISCSVAFTGSHLLAQGRSQAAVFRIPEVRTKLNLANQPVVIVATGTIAAAESRRDQMTFRLELDADLSGLQAEITDVLRTELDKSDHCGDRIDLQHATLAPREPASIVTAQIHYERWGCVKILGKQNARRLVGGNAVVEVKITPRVEDSRAVRMQPEVGTIQADGSLGELLRSGPVEPMLRDKISHAMESAADKGTDFTATLPPAAQEYASIQHAWFKDNGAGRLAVVLQGEIHVNSRQAELLKSQLQTRAQKALARQ